MNVFEQMTRMLGMVPNPQYFTMNAQTAQWCENYAREHFHIILGPDERVTVQRFAGLDIRIDPMVPDNEVYLMGGQDA